MQIYFLKNTCLGCVWKPFYEDDIQPEIQVPPGSVIGNYLSVWSNSKKLLYYIINNLFKAYSVANSAIEVIAGDFKD